jgi:hypothetical protein
MENGPSGCQAPGASLVGVVAPFAAVTADITLLFAVLVHDRGAVGGLGRSRQKIGDNGTLPTGLREMPGTMRAMLLRQRPVIFGEVYGIQASGDTNFGGNNSGSNRW